MDWNTFSKNFYPFFKDNFANPRLTNLNVPKTDKHPAIAPIGNIPIHDAASACPTSNYYQCLSEQDSDMDRVEEARISDVEIGKIEFPPLTPPKSGCMSG